MLDEHLPLAIDILTDLVSHPVFSPDDIEREKKVVLEEIKMVEDTPDDLVHELFAESYWNGHALGRPILGTPDSVSALDQATLRRYFRDAYVADNFVVVAVGNLEHDARARAGRARVCRRADRAAAPIPDSPPSRVAGGADPAEGARAESRVPRHVGLPQNHPDRYAAYALNTVLGGSMSSRLFQNVREKRGLAYAVFSSMSAYQDAGALSIYAGCGNEAVARADRRRGRRDPPRRSRSRCPTTSCAAPRIT